MAKLAPDDFFAKWVPLTANNVFQDIDGERLEALLADIRDSFAPVGVVNAQPVPPAVNFDPATRQLTAQHPLGAAALEVTHNNGGFSAYAPIQVDDYGHGQGEWRFRVAADTGRNPSQLSDSPAIDVKATVGAGGPRSIKAADISDASDDGRALLTADDVAAQIALLDQLGLAAEAYGAGQPKFDKLFGDQGALAYLLRHVAGQQQPAAPTAGQVDDTADTFSFAPNPAYPSFAQYKVSGLPGVSGAVALDATNSYVQGSRVYVHVVGPVATGGLAVYVAGSGAVPDGKVLTTSDAFTGSATPAATKATPPAFGAIDDTNNLVTLSSNYAYTDVRWGLEGQAAQALASNSVCSPGNVAGRLFAYVVGDSASNRLPSDTVYSAPFSVAATATNAPTSSLTVAGGTSSVTPGQSVVLQGVAQDADGVSDVVKIEFFDNGVKIGELAGASGSLQTAALSAGSHSFTAKATDKENLTGLSAAVLVTAAQQAGSIVLSDNDIAILILLCQSNMLSNARLLNALYPPLNLVKADVYKSLVNCRIINVQTNQLEAAVEGTNTRPNYDNTYPVPHSFHMNDSGIWQNGNPAYGYDFDAITMIYFINKWFQQAYPGKQLVICQAAVGGQPRSTMLQGNTDANTPWFARSINQYNQAVQAIQAQGKTPRLLAIAAHQGEADQATPVATYGNQLHQMWADYDTAIPGGTFARIEFQTGRHHDTGYYYDNPHNITKLNWATENARNHAISADYRVVGEDGIHEEANTQNRNGAELVKAACGVAIDFPADITPGSPSATYDASKQLATITPLTSAWLKEEIFYQLGNDAPIQLINSWDVPITRTLQPGEFKLYSRAVPGRAQSPAFVNNAVWATPIRQKIVSGPIQWVNLRGTLISSDKYTATHDPNSAYGNSWQNIALADARLATIPSTFVGRMVRMDVPGIAYNQLAVVLGFVPTLTPADMSAIGGSYTDNTPRLGWQYGSGLVTATQQIYAPNADIPVYAIEAWQTGPGTGYILLLDASGGEINREPSLLGTPCYFAAAVYGAANWAAGMVGSQAPKTTLTSDFLEQAMI